MGGKPGGAGAGARFADDELASLLGDRSMLEQTPFVVSLIDAADCIIYLNRSVPGRNIHDFLGRSIFESIPREHHEVVRDALAKARSGHRQHATFRTVSGFAWEAHYAPVRTQGGVDLVLCTTLDVTERFLVEDALRESEARSRLALEATGLGTWSLDLERDVLEWDDGCCAIWGITRAEAPRTYGAYLAMLPEEERGRAAASLPQLASSERFDGVERRIRRADGEERWVMGMGSITRDESGKPKMARGGILDVTARHALEDQVRQSQKVAAIAQLTGGLAHNFNNLLGVILPNVALCRPQAPAELQPRLDDIEHAAMRAAELVRQLLTLSQPESAAKRSIFDLGAIATRVIRLCSATFPARIVVAARGHIPTAPVYGVAGQLEQVLMNLCLNARDAVLEGSTSEPRIEVSIAAEGGNIVATVTDNGCGMDDTVKERAFDPFFTTKAPGKGTGLGLATAFAIVRDHRGELRCTSRPGQGAVFRISLPEAPPAAAAPDPPAPLPATVNAQSGDTILLVDDEAGVRRAFRGLLERAGYRVIEAVDGVDALAKLKRDGDRIGLVLLDESMPRLSGHGVVEALAAEGSRVPVVFISGHVDLEPGGVVAAVLSKPTPAATLLDTVSQVLRART